MLPLSIRVQKLVASDRAQGVGGHFARDVGLWNRYAIVGAYSEEEDSFGANPMELAGAAYIFEQQPDGNWRQQAKLTASDRSRWAGFGEHVAIHGNFALVGAMYTDEAAGSAYLFQRQPDGRWLEVSKLTAPVRQSKQAFGGAVALSDEIAVVTAQDFNFRSGKAYVYSLGQQGLGRLEAVLETGEKHPPTDDRFGWSVDTDGDTIVIGCPLPYSRNWREVVGAAYVFTRDRFGNWQKEAKLQATVPIIRGLFGGSVAVYGNHIAVGAPGTNSISFSPHRDFNGHGSAYVFTRTNNHQWTQQVHLTSSVGDPNTNDWFGLSVALNKSELLVGAPLWQTDNGLTNSRVHYYTLQNGNWEALNPLRSLRGEENDLFGSSVALSASCALIGAQSHRFDAHNRELINGAGAAYIYGRSLGIVAPIPDIDIGRL